MLLQSSLFKLVKFFATKIKQMTVASHVLVFHTSLLRTKLGFSTAMRMCLPVSKSNAKWCKPGYKPPNFCLLCIINNLVCLFHRPLVPQSILRWQRNFIISESYMLTYIQMYSKLFNMKEAWCCVCFLVEHGCLTVECWWCSHYHITRRGLSKRH